MKYVGAEIRSQVPGLGLSTLDLKANRSGIQGKIEGDQYHFGPHEMAPNRPGTDRKHKKAKKELKVSDIY